MFHYVGFTQSGHKCHNNLHIYLCINCHSKKLLGYTKIIVAILLTIKIWLKWCHTVDGERFAGLNICSFSAIKVFTEIVSHCLGHKYSLFSTIKEKRLYSRKNIRSTPENHEKCESLVSKFFPFAVACLG